MATNFNTQNVDQFTDEEALPVACDAESQAIVAELEQLQELGDNWDGEGGVPIDDQTIAAAQRFIQSLPEPLVVRPQVVPMTDGRLQMEWHRGSRSLELEFESPALVHYLQWDSSLGVEREDEIAVGQSERLYELIRWFHSGLDDA